MTIKIIIKKVKTETALKAQKRELDDREREIDDGVRLKESLLRQKETSIAQDLARLSDIDKQRQTTQQALQDQELRLEALRRQLDNRDAELQRERSEISRTRLAMQTEKELWLMSGTAVSLLNSPGNAGAVAGSSPKDLQAEKSVQFLFLVSVI